MLNEDLGEQESGWFFNKIIEVVLRPYKKDEMPALTIQYHNMKKSMHGKVPFFRLKEICAKSVKKSLIESLEALSLDSTKSETEVHKAQSATIVAMMQLYVSHLNATK